MTILKTYLHFLLASVVMMQGAMAAQPIQDNDPGVRSNLYIDDTRDNYVSGWKAMITNVMPDKLLTTGRWFEPAPVPRPFRFTNEMLPLIDGIRARLRNNSTDGLIVVKDGAIVQHYFRYGFGIDDIHLVHSTGKVFTSFAIQPIYDRISADDLDTPIDRYLPKLKGKFFGESTFRQVLDMQNGMEWTENYEDPTTATMLSGPVGDWDPLNPENGPESWYERMFDFRSTGSMARLGFILVRLSLRRHLLLPQ